MHSLHVKLKSMEMRILMTSENSTAILVYCSNNRGHHTHWQEYGAYFITSLDVLYWVLTKKRGRERLHFYINQIFSNNCVLRLNTQVSYQYDIYTCHVISGYKSSNSTYVREPLGILLLSRSQYVSRSRCDWPSQHGFSSFSSVF
jgi:hypothetical protein